MRSAREEVVFALLAMTAINMGSFLVAVILACVAVGWIKILAVCCVFSLCYAAAIGLQEMAIPPQERRGGGEANGKP